MSYLPKIKRYIFIATIPLAAYKFYKYKKNKGITDETRINNYW